MVEIDKISKAKEIFKKVNNNGYGYYYDDRYSPPLTPRGINCSDEIYPGANENSRKIRNLLRKKIKLDENAFQEVSKTVMELHELMKKDHIGLTKCSEREADHFLDAYVNFDHFKKYKDNNGNEYLRIDPIIRPKYE